MRLAELEDMMAEDPSEGEAAIAELVSSANVEELSMIAIKGRVTALKDSAIKGLGDIGGPDASAALIEMLEAVKGPFLEGGTEQRLEHEGRRRVLVRALAQAKKVPAPAVKTQRDVEAFIESCREA